MPDVDSTDSVSSAAEATEAAAESNRKAAAEALAAKLAEEARVAAEAARQAAIAEAKAAALIAAQALKEQTEREGKERTGDSPNILAHGREMTLGHDIEAGIASVFGKEPELLPSMSIIESNAKKPVDSVNDSKPREATDKLHPDNEKTPASPEALRVSVEGLHKELKDPGFMQSPNTEKLVNQIDSIPPEQKKNIEKLYGQFYPGENLEQELKQKLSPVDALKTIAALNEGSPKEKISLLDVVLHQLDDTTQRQGSGGKGGAQNLSVDSSEHRRTEKDLMSLVSVMNSKDLKALDEQCQKEHHLSLNEYVLKNHDKNLSSQAKDVLTLLTEKGADKRTDADCLHLGRIGLLNQDPELFKIAFGDGHREAAKKFMQNGGLSVIEKNIANETDRKLATDYVKLGHASLSTLLDADRGAMFGRTNIDEIKQAIDGVSAEERKQFAFGLKLIEFPPGRSLTEQEQNAFNRYKEIDKKLHGIYDADKINTPLNERQISGLESRLAFGKDNLVEKLTASQSDGNWVGWGQGHDKEKLFQSVEKMSESEWKQLKSDSLYLKEVQKSLNTFAAPDEAAALRLLIDQKAKAGSFEDSKNYQRDIIERLSDSQTGPFGSTEKLKVISAVCEMTTQEQDKLNPTKKNYDPKFAEALDQNLQKSLGKDSDEYFAVSRMLIKAEHGEKPDSEPYTKLMKLQIGNASFGETMYGIEDTLKQSGALDRYKNPQTDEDHQRKTIVERTLTAAVNRSGEVHEDKKGNSNFNDVYSKYERMLLNNDGKLPIAENVKLADSHINALETFFKYATPDEKQQLISSDPNNTKADDLRSSLRSKLSTEELQILINAAAQEKSTLSTTDDAKTPQTNPLKAEDYLRAFVLEPYHTSEETQLIKEKLKTLREDGTIEAVSNAYIQKYGSQMKTAVVDAACKQDNDEFKELVKGYTTTDFSTLANTLQNSKDAQSGILGDVNYGTKINHTAQVQDLADKMRIASTEFKQLPERESRELVEKIISQQHKWEESKASVAHTAVDGAVFIGSAALGLASAGSFTALELTLAGATAAAIDVSTKRALEGTQYKPEQARADFISQAAMFPLMMFGPGEALSATGFGAKTTARVAERFMESATAKGLDNVLVEGADKKLAKELQEVLCRAKVNGTKIPENAADTLVDQLVKPTLSEAERTVAKAEVADMVNAQFKRMGVELSFVEKLGKQTSDQVLTKAGATSLKVNGQAELKLVDAISETGKKRLESNLQSSILKASQNGRDSLQQKDIDRLAWEMLKPSLNLEQRQAAKESLTNILSENVKEVAPKVVQQTLIEQAQQLATKYSVHSGFGAGVGATGAVFGESLRLDSKQAPDVKLRQLLNVAQEGAKFGAELSAGFHFAGDSFNLGRKAFDTVITPVSISIQDTFTNPRSEVQSKVSAEAVAKMDAEFARLSDPQQKRAIELTVEDLKRVAVSPNDLTPGAKPISVYDKVMQDGTMTAEQKVSVLKNMSEVREHYGSVKDLGDGKIYADQHVSWVHTIGELGRSLQLAEEKGLSAEERHLTTFAAMYSDSVKYSGGTPGYPYGNFFVHHLRGMEAAEAAMQRQNFSTLDRQFVREAIETHQGTPKEFMARLYTFPVDPTLAKMSDAMAKIEDPALRAAQEKDLAQLKKTWESMTEVDPNAPYLRRITKIAEASPTTEGNVKTPDGRWKVDFTPMEQKVLQLAGIKDWYVSVDPKLDPEFKRMTPKQQELELTRYKINQTVIDADCLENYAYGAGKFVAIRGEGTIFPDKNYHQSIKSVDDSALDSLASLSPQARKIMESDLLQRKAKVDNGLQQYMDKFYNQNPEYVVNGKRIYDTLDIAHPQKLTADEAARLSSIESRLKEENKLPALNDLGSMNAKERAGNIDRFVKELEAEPEYKSLKFKGLSSEQITDLEKSRVVRDEVVQFFRETGATNKNDVLTRTSYERALDQSNESVETSATKPSDTSGMNTKLQLELMAQGLGETTSRLSNFAEKLLNVATESPVAKLPNSLALNDYNPFKHTEDLLWQMGVSEQQQQSNPRFGPKTYFQPTPFEEGERFSRSKQPETTRSTDSKLYGPDEYLAKIPLEGGGTATVKHESGAIVVSSDKDGALLGELDYTITEEGIYVKHLESWQSGSNIGREMLLVVQEYGRETNQSVYLDARAYESKTGSLKQDALEQFYSDSGFDPEPSDSQRFRWWPF